MYYAMMRPSEVAALTQDGCDLPSTGWGYLAFADSSPAAGKAYTDHGRVHEHRGLKGRTSGRAGDGQQSRRAVRKIPIPPELVALLREHLTCFGAGRTGSCSAARPASHPAVHLVRVWQKVRARR